MHLLKQWTMTICVFSVIISVVKMLSPTSTFNKTISLTVRLFLVGLILWPFFTDLSVSNIQSVPSKITTTQNDSDVIDMALSLAGKNLQNQIQQTLKREGIEPSRVTVQFHIDENRCISFCEVVIVTDKQEQAVKQIVKMHYGLEPTVKKVDPEDI